MADIFDQVSTPTPQPGAPAPQSAPTSTGDVFDQVGQAQPDQQQQQPAEQPGFLQRASETSPLPGIIDAAKQTFQHSMDAPVEGEQTFHDMTDALRAGDFRGAVGKAAKLLTGSETPFSDAAKSVIAGVTKDAHQTGRDVLAQIPGASAVKNYIGDVKAGNTSGAIGDVVGGVASIAPALLGDEASAARVNDVAGKVAGSASDVVGKVKPLVSEEAAAATAQPGVQGAVRGAAEDTAGAENVTLKAATSVRDAVQNTADSILERSKGTYQQLDDLSGGRWQRFSDSIKNLRDKADEVGGIDEDKFDEYTQRAKDIEQAQADLVDNLVKDGKIDADTAQSATEDYRKAQSLYDLSQQIRNSTKGVPADVAGAGSTPEMVDASQLLPKLNKLRDSGRLAQAIGEDGAAQLIRDVDKAAQTKAAAISRVKLIKTVGKYAAVGAGLGALGHGAASILGGGH